MYIKGTRSASKSLFGVCLDCSADERAQLSFGAHFELVFTEETDGVDVGIESEVCLIPVTISFQWSCLLQPEKCIKQITYIIK